MPVFGVSILISTAIYANFQSERDCSSIVLFNKNIKCNISTQLGSQNDSQYSWTQQMTDVSDIERFYQLLSSISTFFSQKEMHSLKIYNEMKTYDGVKIHVDSAISIIKLNPYLKSIDDMGQYYSVTFKGKYRFSPIIGFSIKKDGKDGYVELPYVKTKVEE